jgi:hypothetical protein
MTVVCEPCQASRPVGESQTPTLKDIQRYLRSIGAVFIGHGKGDHEKWKLRDGTVVILNAARRHRKEVDFASLKALAEALGLNITQLAKAISG